MATIEKALQIAAQAHEGQKDKEGLPYILHSLRVMHAVAGADAQIVAVLHDVIEDTAVTVDEMRPAGFSEEVLAAVRRTAGTTAPSCGPVASRPTWPVT